MRDQNQFPPADAVSVETIRVRVALDNQARASALVDFFHDVRDTSVFLAASYLMHQVALRYSDGYEKCLDDLRESAMQWRHRARVSEPGRDAPSEGGDE